MPGASFIVTVANSGIPVFRINTSRQVDYKLPILADSLYLVHRCVPDVHSTVFLIDVIMKVLQTKRNLCWF